MPAEWTEQHQLLEIPVTVSFEQAAGEAVTQRVGGGLIEQLASPLQRGNCLDISTEPVSRRASPLLHHALHQSDADDDEGSPETYYGIASRRQYVARQDATMESVGSSQSVRQ